jgi:MFS family permease
MYTIKSNIAGIYALSFFQSLMVLTAIYVPLLQGHGLSMSQVLQTQAVFALVIAACEVPSGYLADTWGRKRAIVLGTALCAIGFGILPFCKSFTDFLVYELILGVGISMSSGADLALLYDSQLQLKREGSDHAGNNHIARLVSLEGIAGAFGAIAASLLSYHSLQAVAITQAIVNVIPFLIALCLVEVPREISTVGHRQNRDNIVADMVSQPLVFLTAAAMIVFGLSGLAAFWLYQNYWAISGIPVTAFGYIWAGYCLVRGTAARFASDFENSLGAKRLLALLALLIVIAMAAMALTASWWGVVLGALIPLSRGISTVIFTDALNKRVSSNFRATINSLVSLGMRAIFIICGPLLGIMIDSQGVSISWSILAIVCAIVFTAVLMPLYASIKKEPVEAIHEQV